MTKKLSEMTIVELRAAVVATDSAYNAASAVTVAAMDCAKDADNAACAADAALTRAMHVELSADKAYNAAKAAYAACDTWVSHCTFDDECRCDMCGG